MDGNTPHQLTKENNMKTKAEQLEELKATAVKLQQQIAELESSKCKRFEPEFGDSYGCVDDVGSTHCINYDDSKFDEGCYDNFNCYETQELATKASPMMRRNNAIIMACLMVDPDFVPDYKSGNQKHYAFEYANPSLGRDGEWVERVGYTVNKGPCVSTQEKWDEAAALLKEWGIE